MGTLPVDICAVSVVGSMVVASVEYVEMSVCTHVSVRSPLLEESRYARYGSLCSRIFQIGTAYANAVSRGKSIWLVWLLG
jgi:hypothetical protein